MIQQVLDPHISYPNRHRNPSTNGRTGEAVGKGSRKGQQEWAIGKGR